MTREDIKACCKKISPGYSEDSACDFADNVQTLGFIDTSQGQNGSRGIVFSTNHMMLNTDGSLRIIFYRNITDVKIIDSFEDAFSDELEIVCAGEEFRVSNCSLNKAELKSLLDKLCDGGLRGEGPARITPPPPKPPANTIAVTATPPEPARSAAAASPVSKEKNAADLLRTAAPLETVSNEDTRAEQPKNDAQPIEKRRTEQPGNDIQARENGRNERPGNDIRARENLREEQPREELHNDDNGEDIVIESDTPVIFETVINRKGDSDPLPKDDDFNNTEERLKIQNMTPEETMSFLAQSLSEINSPVYEEPRPEPAPELVQRVQETPPATINDYNPLQPETPQKPKGLTVEPVWGDIYIKASRNLRELCESNKLSMKQIETELNNKLLDSTKAFAEITSDESRVPKVLIPKITELKAAAQNFDQYFQLGEDIAVRAMFFMLYQMLSYADRIVETPETKEGLNDFFRRFGPAGIMLSMLDMRV